MNVQIPPLSILDTRRGYWLDRKKYWNNILPESLEGRNEHLSYSKGISALNGGMNGTSRFDPTLTELIYNWFIPQNCKNICDPFSGGNTRGLIAEILKYKYIGFEVRKEQLEIDNNHAKEIKVNPIFIHDTSLNLLEYVNKESQDLIFTCPPYYNLEIYSNQNDDLSNCKTYEEFLDSYKIILKNCYDVLKSNRFFVIVVSEIRNKGIYCGLVSDTINILKSFNLKFYNDAILINNFGTAHLRIANSYRNRKLVRVHQNVLIFYKGNVDEIKNIFTEENILVDKKQLTF